jgi:membrane protease YdiL (CAAX protease family)
LERDVVPAHGSLAAFFILVFILSIPFYVAGSLTKFRLLPGLPVSSLALVAPALAASIMIWHEKRAAGVIALLKRSFDLQQITPKSWLLPILVLMPCATVLEYGMMRALRLPLPDPHVSVQRALLLLAPLFAAALAEELGWSGYAIERLQARWTALASGVLVGLVWAVWHAIPLVQAERPASWMAWWALGSVASRVVMTWLFVNTRRSVFGAALFHSTINLSWQMFPNNGSHWDPKLNALVVTACAITVTMIWGPRTLARYGG